MSQESMAKPGTAIAATQVAAGNIKAEKELVVNVTGLQYAWLFNYPDTDITTGELHLPIGREVKINLAANDVIHAFWIPEFRLKQDAIPGRETTLHFKPRTAGDYKLICAELCGPNHGAMKAEVVVESPEAFDNWIQEQLVASKANLNQAVAANPADLSPAKFLAPYTHSWGIQPEILHQVHSIKSS
jgi:cytochrome c oxidase subunit 2